MIRTLGLAVLSILFTACSSDPPRDPAIGEAYAGPLQLKLREEINPRSKTVATVPHGERLEIVRQRRRFYRVRTAGGVEGWTDERMLLSSREIATLTSRAEETKSAPRQAAATVFEDLNVHTEPYRTAPSFYVMRANEQVDVIGRRITARSAKVSRKILDSPPPVAKKAAKKKKEPKLPPVPMPPAPKPPADWLELSQRSRSEEPAAAAAIPRVAEPEPVDDWSLIRTKDGQTGWALTRRLYMAIPDEVAQYAEGHRIRAFFPLAEVRDGDKVKHNWLWATAAGGDLEYEFDSIRLFTYNPRKHRYETSYIERNLRGYYPILFHPVPEPQSLSGKGSGGKLPGFSILVDKKDGSRARRSYAMWDTRVRSAGEQVLSAGTEAEPPESRPPLVTGAPPPVPNSFFGRVQGAWRNLKDRISK